MRRSILRILRIDPVRKWIAKEEHDSQLSCWTQTPPWLIFIALATS
jgi:hypothetical protein